MSSHHVTTAAALGIALQQARAGDGVSLIQAIVPRMEVPNLLSLIAREASRANQRSD